MPVPQILAFLFLFPYCLLSLGELIHFNEHYVLTDFPLIVCPDLPSDPRLLALIATHHPQLDIS